MLVAAAARAADRELTLLMHEGGHYVGGFNDYQPDGQGTMYHPGDRTASGQWRNGKQNGIGTFNFPLGGLYEGNFVDGKYSGLGKWTCPDGDVFEGEWADNKRSGFGVIWAKDGKVTQCGRWDNDNFVQTRPVPRRKLPAGTIRHAAGQPPTHRALARSAHTHTHMVQMCVWLSLHQTVFSFRSARPRFTLSRCLLCSPANDAALLFPDGRFYRGEFNAQLKRHGWGSTHAADGDRLGSGNWLNDELIKPQQLEVAGPQRRALLIGNRRTSDDGAEAMRDALGRSGFECTLLLDATYRQMTDGIREFIDALQPNDVVFIYFSGRGVESHGRTYLLPTDFDSGRHSLSDGAVSLTNVMCDLNRKSDELTNVISESLINIIVLDCCRGQLPAAGDQVTGIRNVTLPDHGRFFVTYPVDSPRSDGYFTHCLLPLLQEPGWHLEQIFQQVNKQLGNHQQMRQQTSLRMDLALLPGK